MRHRIRFLLILMALTLTGWGGYRLAGWLTPQDNWQTRDLRALNRTPESNLRALLMRPRGLGCQIRLDFLNLPPVYRLDFTLGEKTYPFTNDSPQTANLRLQADAALDTITLTLALCPPDAPVTIRLNGESLAGSLNGYAPESPLPLHLIFYNTFESSATPAQALRRWDGAHSGPRGERHGLKGLLDAAEQNAIPLTLLDLKTPLALPALDALGALNQIRRMEAGGLLELPTVMYAPGDFLSLVFSRSAAHNFGLQASLPYFIVKEPNLALRFLADQPPLDREGWPLATRHRLYQALSTRQILTLGGDFQQSTWGTGEYAAPALAWLAARPYFQAQNGALLLPQKSPECLADSPACLCSLDPNQITLWPLGSADPNHAMFLEWMAQRSPATDARLTQAYAGGSLSVWAQYTRWLVERSSGAVCEGDWCWLMTERYFAAIDLRGGKVTHLFDGWSQLLGPTSQFFVGISDASRWDFSKGQGADPAQVTGSFADGDNPFRRYQVEVVKDGVRAVAVRLSAGARVKRFELNGRGLQVIFNQPDEALAALAVAPQERFLPGWAGRYRLEQTPTQVSFGLENGPRIRITASAGTILAAESFLDAIPLLALPEDPNTAMPDASFLPFPIGLLRLKVGPDAPLVVEGWP